MPEKELIACIALVVIICFIIAALLGTMREVSQAEDTIWDHDIREAILRDRLEKQKETILQLVADMRKLRSEREGVCNCTFLLKESLRGKHGPDFRKNLTLPTRRKTPLTMRNVSGSLFGNAKENGRNSHPTATPA